MKRKITVVPTPMTLASLMFVGTGFCPVTTITKDTAPARDRTRKHKTHATARGRYAGMGRTNGMPWDGTSPVTEAPIIGIPDPQKPKVRMDAGMGLLLASCRKK